MPFRHLRRVTWIATCLFICGCVACSTPKNQRMPVACMYGDFFSHSARARVWKDGDRVECRLPRRSVFSEPDKRGDILLCGDQTQVAWDEAWLKSDIRDQIYANATMFEVTFHGTGRSNKNSGPSWWCRKLSQGIDCE